MIAHLSRHHDIGARAHGKLTEITEATAEKRRSRHRHLGIAPNGRHRLKRIPKTNGKTAKRDGVTSTQASQTSRIRVLWVLEGRLRLHTEKPGKRSPRLVGAIKVGVKRDHTHTEPGGLVHDGGTRGALCRGRTEAIGSRDVHRVMRQQHVATQGACCAQRVQGGIQRAQHTAYFGIGIAHGEPHMVPGLSIPTRETCEQGRFKVTDEHRAPPRKRPRQIGRGPQGRRGRRRRCAGSRAHPHEGSP